MAALSEPSVPQEREADNLPPKSYKEAVEEPATHLARDDVGGSWSNLEDEANGNQSEKMTNGVGGKVKQVNGIQKKKPRSSEKPMVNGIHKHTNKQNENNMIFEKYEDKKGGRLTSVKPHDGYEESLQLDQSQSKNPKKELVSGRQAGAGWQRSKIRWAPLNVPLQRRLQTLVVLIHSLTMVSMLTLFFFLCSIPILWPILLPYLLFVLLSNAHANGKLEHRSEAFRGSPIWSLFASYFPARLHRSEELPATRKYIFGYHPHGIISHGAFAAFCTEALGFSQLFPGITNTLLTLESNFRIPLYRDYALRMGLGSVSRESCENLLSKGGLNGEGMGRAITIVIGGAQESLDARPHTLGLVLKRRKGFVKTAVRAGADLVPVLSFGENDLYEQLDAATHPRIHKFQMLVKKIAGFTIPLFHARGVFNYDVGLQPYRRPVNIVVGRPIKVTQQSIPEAAYVDELHGLYIAELERIWDDWKDTFAKERVSELELIE